LDEIEKNLLTKPMYQDDKRRKNRLESLKSLMVKELLFSEFINKLVEPKPVKISKAKKAILQKEENINEITEPVITNIVEKKKAKKSKVVVPEGVMIADIKIVKNSKTGKIVSDANISDGQYIVWTYHNDSCYDKYSEIIKIIADILEHNNEKIYKISINYKLFVKDYYEAITYYNELTKNPNIVTLENIFETQNIGHLKTVNKVRTFSKIILNHKMFSCV